MKEKAGFVIEYIPLEDGSVTVKAISENEPLIEASFKKERVDEGRILFVEAAELVESRAKANDDHAKIRTLVDKLFASFRGETVSFADETDPKPERKPSGEFVPNPGKQIAIEVDGIRYDRLPVRTRLITLKDKDIFPIIEDYVAPYLKPGDTLYISEKALCITQGQVISMSDIHPGALARFLARRVGNNYGSEDFYGFGHGTSLAMQLFIEEAGYLRILFAAAVSAITKKMGIHGLFYRISGVRAKSIDCPMSFLILEYAHSAKLAPHDPNGVAKAIKKRFGVEAVILDANYRGAFSLGKSTPALSEEFIGKLFRDNPLGQSDEMTPFAIARKA